MDPNEVRCRIEAYPPGSPTELVDSLLFDARKRAKLQMARLHPDRGGDAVQFKRVQPALQNVEKYFEEFKEKVLRKMVEDREKEQMRFSRLIHIRK